MCSRITTVTGKAEAKNLTSAVMVLALLSNVGGSGGLK